MQALNSITHREAPTKHLLILLVMQLQIWSIGGEDVI